MGCKLMHSSLSQAMSSILTTISNLQTWNKIGDPILHIEASSYFTSLKLICNSDPEPVSR